MRLTNKGKKSIYIQDVNGGIAYSRTLLAPLMVADRERFHRLTGRDSIAPLDNYLGVDKLPFSMTYAMMARVATIGIKSKSFAEASNTLKDAGYKRISASMVDQVCEVVGQAIWNYYEARADIVDSRISRGEKIGPAAVDIHKIKSLNPEKVLILMMDGHTVYLRKYSTGKYDINDGGKCGKECRVGIAFMLSNSTVESDQEGRESVRITKKDLTALICPNNQFRNYFGDLALRNGADKCDLIVAISDGADWLHNMTNELFHSCLHIRDLWHVKECIGEFCKAIYPNDPESGSTFANSLCALIEEGKIKQYLEKLEPYKDHTINANGNKLVNPYVYVANRRDGMEYDLYKHLGLPVGSGAMESANKDFHRRMRTTGSLWTNTKANRMVMTIATIESGGEALVLYILLDMKDKLLKIRFEIEKGEVHRKYHKSSENVET